MFNRMKMILTVALGRMLGRTPESLHRLASDHNRTVDAVREVVRRNPMREPPLALRPRSVSSFLDGWAARLIPTRRVDRSKMHWGPNGAQERVRRMHRNTATLWTDAQGRRWTQNSHGYPVGFGWVSGPNNPKGRFI